MQRVEDPIETVHLYVVREDMSKPPSLLPVYLGLFFFVGIVCVARAFISIPTTRPMTYRVPAIFLPAVTFQTAQALIPTGKEVIPATVAHGTLTIYNGSVVSQTLPPGMIFQSKEGVEV